MASVFSQNAFNKRKFGFSNTINNVLRNPRVDFKQETLTNLSTEIFKNSEEFAMHVISCILDPDYNATPYDNSFNFDISNILILSYERIRIFSNPTSTSKFPDGLRFLLFLALLRIFLLSNPDVDISQSSQLNQNINSFKNFLNNFVDKNGTITNIREIHTQLSDSFFNNIAITSEGQEGASSVKFTYKGKYEAIIGNQSIQNKDDESKAYDSCTTHNSQNNATTMTQDNLLSGSTNGVTQSSSTTSLNSNNSVTKSLFQKKSKISKTDAFNTVSDCINSGISKEVRKEIFKYAVNPNRQDISLDPMIKGYLDVLSKKNILNNNKDGYNNSICQVFFLLFISDVGQSIAFNRQGLNIKIFERWYRNMCRDTKRGSNSFNLNNFNVYPEIVSQGYGPQLVKFTIEGKKLTPLSIKPTTHSNLLNTALNQVTFQCTSINVWAVTTIFLAMSEEQLYSFTKEGILPNFPVQQDGLDGDKLKEVKNCWDQLSGTYKVSSESVDQNLESKSIDPQNKVHKNHGNQETYHFPPVPTYTPVQRKLSNSEGNPVDLSVFPGVTTNTPSLDSLVNHQSTEEETKGNEVVEANVSKSFATKNDALNFLVNYFNMQENEVMLFGVVFMVFTGSNSSELLPDIESAVKKIINPKEKDGVIESKNTLNDDAIKLLVIIFTRIYVIKLKKQTNYKKFFEQLFVQYTKLYGIPHILSVPQVGGIQLFNNKNICLTIGNASFFINPYIQHSKLVKRAMSKTLKLVERAMSKTRKLVENKVRKDDGVKLIIEEIGKISVLDNINLRILFGCLSDEELENYINYGKIQSNVAHIGRNQELITYIVGLLDAEYCAFFDGKNTLEQKIANNESKSIIDNESTVYVAPKNSSGTLPSLDFLDQFPFDDNQKAVATPLSDENKLSETKSLQPENKTYGEEVKSDSTLVQPMVEPTRIFTTQQAAVKFLINFFEKSPTNETNQVVRTILTGEDGSSLLPDVQAALSKIAKNTGGRHNVQQRTIGEIGSSGSVVKQFTDEQTQVLIIAYFITFQVLDSDPTIFISYLKNFTGKQYTINAFVRYSSRDGDYVRIRIQGVEFTIKYNAQRVKLIESLQRNIFSNATNNNALVKNEAVKELKDHLRKKFPRDMDIDDLIKNIQGILTKNPQELPFEEVRKFFIGIYCRHEEQNKTLNPTFKLYTAGFSIWLEELIGICDRLFIYNQLTVRPDQFDVQMYLSRLTTVQLSQLNSGQFAALPVNPKEQHIVYQVLMGKSPIYGDQYLKPIIDSAEKEYERNLLICQAIKNIITQLQRTILTAEEVQELREYLKVFSSEQLTNFLKYCQINLLSKVHPNNELCPHLIKVLLYREELCDNKPQSLREESNSGGVNQEDFFNNFFEEEFNLSNTTLNPVNIINNPSDAMVCTDEKKDFENELFNEKSTVNETEDNCKNIVPSAPLELGPTLPVAEASSNSSKRLNGFSARFEGFRQSMVSWGSSFFERVRNLYTSPTSPENSATSVNGSQSEAQYLKPAWSTNIVANDHGNNGNIPIATAVPIPQPPVFGNHSFVSGSASFSSGFVHSNLNGASGFAGYASAPAPAYQQHTIVNGQEVAPSFEYLSQQDMLQNQQRMLQNQQCMLQNLSQYCTMLRTQGYSEQLIEQFYFQESQRINALYPPVDQLHLWNQPITPSAPLLPGSYGGEGIGNSTNQAFAIVGEV